MKSLVSNLKQRTHTRHATPAIAIIDNAQYQVDNWSVGGLCLSKFYQQAQVGDCFSLQFCLNLQQGISLSFKTLIEIVWQSQTQKQLGAKFLNLTQLETDLLQQASSNLHPEVVITKTTPAVLLKDPPAEDKNNYPSPEPSSPRPTKKYSYKLVISTLAYLTVGSLLGGAALVSVYDATRSLKIKSASITDTVEQVVSIDDGILSQVYVQSGKKVRAGQPLLQIFNNAAIEREVTNINALVRDKTTELEDLTRQIELNRLDLAEAQSVQRKNAALKQQELLELNSYSAIAHSNLDSAHAKVKSLEVQQQTTAENLKRFGSLLKEGAVSQQTYDEKKAELATLDAELITAREAVNIARTSIESVRIGKFYNGNDLVGNLSSINAEAIELQEQAKLASLKIDTFTKARQRQEQELQKLKQQKSNLENAQFNHNSQSEIDIPTTVYQAPVSGTVVRVAKSFGNTINRGETLILLRPDTKTLTIDAYLTQDQAALVAMGSQATVTIPASGKQYQAKIVEIDRTGGFKDAVKGKYLLEGSQEQPAYVKLALTSLDLKATEQLTGGTPVLLEFVKPPIFPRLKAKISEMVS
jgi:multidrug resistance efflux pump